MHILVSAVGSAGDVYPFIAIGRVLARRGHEVEILASPQFQCEIERAGLGFAGFGTAEDYRRIVGLPDVWHPRRGLRLILRELLERLPAAFDATAQRVRPGETVLVGSTLAWNARLVQERLGTPLATVHLAPACLASATQPPVLPGVGDLSWLPAGLVRLLQSLGERLLVDPAVAGELNRVRERLGLPPVRRVLSRWMHSPDALICAWPDWFAPAQPDWPAQARTTGFPLWKSGAPALEPRLEAFLQAGPPPLGFTPGSAMAHGRGFFERAVAACARLRRRALLLTPYADQVPQPLPEGMLHCGQAPFDLLVPRLAGLVHHGGIGTCAQALAAGVPQLVVPFAHDQFDNAARLRRIGAGAQLKREASVARWVEAVDALEGDRAMAAAAGGAAERMRDFERPMVQIADLVVAAASGATRAGDSVAGRPSAL